MTGHRLKGIMDTYLTDTPADPATELSLLAQIEYETVLELRRTVRRLRRAGRTWDTVADGLGVTRSAAIQRFKPFMDF